MPPDPQHPPLSISVGHKVTRCTGLSNKTRLSVIPSQNKTPNRFPRWNFRKCDYHLLYSLLTSTDWSQIYGTQSLQESIDIFYTLLNAAIDKCVPKQRPKPSNCK